MAQVFPVRSMIDLFKDVFYRTKPQSSWSEEVKAIAPTTYTWTDKSCPVKSLCAEESDATYKIGSVVMLHPGFEDQVKAAIAMGVKPHILPNKEYKIADFLFEEPDYKEGNPVALARLTNGKIVNVSRLRLV